VTPSPGAGVHHVMCDSASGEHWSDLVTDGANQTGKVLHCRDIGYGYWVLEGDEITIPGVFAQDAPDQLKRFIVRKGVQFLKTGRVDLTLDPPIVKGQTVSTLPANIAWISVWKRRE